MDYRLLLKKYMDKVSAHEGVTFVEWCENDAEFSAEEFAELKAIEKEVIEGM